MLRLRLILSVVRLLFMGFRGEGGPDSCEEQFKEAFGILEKLPKCQNLGASLVAGTLIAPKGIAATRPHNTQHTRFNEVFLLQNKKLYKLIRVVRKFAESSR